VLDNIRSQNNTGSIFRTADAFRLEGVYLAGSPRRHHTVKSIKLHWERLNRLTGNIFPLRRKHYKVFLQQGLPPGVEQVEESILLPDFILSQEVTRHCVWQ